MSKMLFTLYEDSIIIDNITLIKEFQEELFRIEINNVPYEIKGENLILNQVTNDNKTIKITGTILSVKVETNKPKNKTNFIRRLFS